MAVAGAAVEMGPRDRRRAARGAVALGVVAALAAAVLLTRWNDRPVPPSPAQPVTSAPSSHLTFGMTPRQVQHLTGKPTETRGQCWFFRPSGTGMVGSVSVQPSFATVPFDPRTTGNLKLCFLGGAYSYSELRAFDKRQHKWVWGAWPLGRIPATPAP